MYRQLLFLSIFICSSLPATGQSAGGEEVLSEFLRISIADNEVFTEGVSGFHLYDIAADRTLFAHNAEKYFVPASNVKLLTFYLTQRVLGDRAPALRFYRYADRIECWPTGYPLLLHPDFFGYDGLGPWISGQSLPLVFHFGGVDSAPPRYGSGWSWDDYDYGYVYERSGLPIYGNRLHLEIGSLNGDQLYGTPPEVATNLIQDEGQDRLIHREEGSNVFSLREDFTTTARFPVERALITSDAFTLRQLQRAFPKQRITGSTAAPVPITDTENLELSLPDTLFRKLLQDSDNFLAEQLILQCAAVRYGRFDEAALFDYATDTLFADLDLGPLRYADGSGLSRYNLVKPRQLTQIVTALFRELGTNRLLDLLPAGGGSGTLKNRFDDRPETYVWAKTGTLSGVTCISGLLRTKRGRWLAFSFLHNNVVGGTRDYYREMERVLGGVYDRL